VLLVDTDQQHAECVCLGLGFHHFETDLCLDPERAAVRLRRAADDYDVVILNVSNPSLPWVNILAKLQAACLESGASPAPLFLCTSTTKRLPEFELQIERLGARYVCER
jgi:DNA-binding response OmpR family regulator